MTEKPPPNPNQAAIAAIRAAILCLEEGNTSGALVVLAIALKKLTSQY